MTARRLAALATALLLPPSSAVAEPPIVDSPPGGLVRWPGEAIEECSMGGRSWRPLAGACWFPVDLLTEAGELEVGRRRAGVAEQALIRVGDYPYPVQHITLEDDSKVHLSPADQERTAREAERIAELWSADGPPRFELPLVPPLEPLPEAGRFGARRFFNDVPRSPHTGADYAASAGTPVHAVADGTVVLAGDLFFSGKSLFVHHGDGLISMYFHLSESGVGEGAEVERGQVIGRVGATGRATGPHLHFGVRWRGARVDPALLVGAPASLPTVP